MQSMFLLQQHQIYWENLQSILPSLRIVQYVENEIFKCHFQDRVIRPILFKIWSTLKF